MTAVDRCILRHAGSRFRNAVLPSCSRRSIASRSRLARARRASSGSCCWLCAEAANSSKHPAHSSGTIRRYIYGRYLAHWQGPPRLPAHAAIALVRVRETLGPRVAESQSVLIVHDPILSSSTRIHLAESGWLTVRARWRARHVRCAFVACITAAAAEAVCSSFRSCTRVRLPGDRPRPLPLPALGGWGGCGGGGAAAAARLLPGGPIAILCSARSASCSRARMAATVSSADATPCTKQAGRQQHVACVLRGLPCIGDDQPSS
jgi:hypothetical protein